ncbi:dihydroorotate dehydrogenase [Candidatus Margulisiibacteriota bacterium]
MVDIKTEIAGIKIKTPVMVASGTFGSGSDYKDLVDLDEIGAIITKSVSLKPRKGNPPPRICETPSGMLNTIGLENPGIEAFIEDDIKFLKGYKVPVIVNIAGETLDEYIELAKILDKEDRVNGIELNISCPNVKKGCISFGIDPLATKELVRAVKKETKKPIITKLTPNVTDITVIAKAAEEAGTDAISLINTVLGMSIDITTKKTKLSMGQGGLSGPAIKPIAVRMVNQVYKAVKVPIIGMGGIMNADDAIEFMLAGASAVSIGTGNFVDPTISVEIAKGIKAYLTSNKLNSVKDIVGKVKTS